MISLILPYWDRQPAANAAFLSLERCYGCDDEIEIIVVDDGNGVPFVVPETSLNVRVVRLPEKAAPTPQSRAWNAGVAAASGEIVVLSCVEILHTAPVLQAMREQLEAIGPKGYVLAAAWCPEEGKWHCHSTAEIPTCPAGTGPSFCGMLHKAFFPGFDEQYHDGAGYEDKDFIWRMTRAGAQFAIRDDLIVTHPKTGAKIAWKPEGFERNAAIYSEIWSEFAQEIGIHFQRSKPVTFVCLNAGNYCGRGAEYVNNLFDMVQRNLSPNINGRFVCVTDDPVGLHPEIATIALPKDVKGWWGKLYLFKPGLFPQNERIVYLDLDTLIVGPLDEIVSYGGDFATLRDFYTPERLGPAIMLWRSGFGGEIWDQWEAQGRPDHVYGDLWWINQLNGGEFADRADKLQALFPDRFVSYKAQATTAPPLGSSVVCFHGLPRPHEVGGWVAQIWQVGGLTSSELTVVNNINAAAIKSNIHSASLRDIGWLGLKDATLREVLIVGGGPSLKGDVAQVKAKQAAGAYVMALNGAAAFLHESGIRPDCAVVIDARESNLRFVDGADAYFLASQCAPCLFDRAGDKATLFHIDIPELGSFVPGDRPIQAVGGGVTVGLIAMSVAYTQGFRTMHLYGYDSSYADSAHHAYRQPENDAEPLLTAHVGGKEFICAPWMVVQTNQFQDLAKQLIEMGCAIHVHGNGLLPTVAWTMAHQFSLPAPQASGFSRHFQPLGEIDTCSLPT